MSLVDTSNPDRPIHHRGDQLEAAFFSFRERCGRGGRLTKRTAEKQGRNAKGKRSRDEFYCKGTKEETERSRFNRYIGRRIDA